MNRTTSTPKQTLGLTLSSLNFQESIKEIIDLATDKQQGYICFANAHMTVEANQDPSFADQLNQATYVFPDGMPLVWAMKLLHRQAQERVAGMDMLPALLAEAEKCGLAVYFYGSTPEVLQAIQQRASLNYPQLKIVGLYSPPFGQSSEATMMNDIRNINQSGAQLVFVALGCPKQEKWMAKYTHQVQAVLLGVGGAFPVFAQQHSRAPQWMREIGMEWFFRFVQEPKRLWKRYLTTNTYFIWLFIQALLKK